MIEDIKSNQTIPELVLGKDFLKSYIISFNNADEIILKELSPEFRTQQEQNYLMSLYPV